MRARHLAAAIVLQAIEDLWSPVCRQESMDFFAGELFRLAAETSGMSFVDQGALLGILERNGILRQHRSFLPDCQQIKPALLSYN